MRKKLPFAIVLFLTAISLFPLSVNIRTYDHEGYTRVVLEGDRSFEYKVAPVENAIDIELKEKAQVPQSIEVFRNSKLLDRVVHRWEESHSVFRLHTKSAYKIQRSFVLEQPYRVVIDLHKTGKEITVTSPPASQMATKIQEPVPNKPNPTPQEEPQKEMQLTDETSPEQTEKPTKRFIIETICIDPGHGGTDLGAVGRSKIQEKEITLNVSRKLRRLIESKLGLAVVMTRDSDEEVSLNSRVSVANNRKAQLFISIHVNSSFRKSARGPETYYVSLKATDQEAFRLSEKENNSLEEIETVAEGGEDLKMILWNMAQTEYIKESSKLADFLQFEMNELMNTRNRGVKQAPFRVLMRADMPAVLVEIAFISNAAEEKQLKDEEFLAKVAETIYTGVSKFIYYHNNLIK